MAGTTSPVKKFFELLRFQKGEISSIYFYAILNGLVQLSLPLGIQSIISFVLGGAISTSLVLLITLVLAGVFITGLLQVNQMKLIEKIQQQLFVRYSFQYAHVIPNFNLRAVDRYYLPELVNRFFDTIPLQKSISKLLLDIPGASIQILFGIILLSFYHPAFIAFGFVLLLLLYATLRLTAAKGLETSLQESDYKYRVLGYLEELARVAFSFKFSKNRSHHLKKTDEYVAGYLEARTSHFKVLLFQYWAMIGFKLLITSAMLIVGAYLLIGQELNIGQFIATEIVILMIIGSVEKLILNLDIVYDVLTSVEKITKVTETPLEAHGTAQVEKNHQGMSVEAEHLSFGYEQGKLIIRDLNFKVNRGDKVAVRGSNNSGKSTLLRLLCGTYDDFEGSLLINGIPIRSYDLHSLRSNIGISLQNQEVFHGTIHDNICLGEKGISYEELNHLAEIVGLKPYIASKKEGYHYTLQPTGQHIPSRVKQQILLLRALVNQPSLLLLEEPWKDLDSESAARLKRYLLEEIPHVTVLIATADDSFCSKCGSSIILERSNPGQQ